MKWRKEEDDRWQSATRMLRELQGSEIHQQAVGKLLVLSRLLT
jgi:hypothetical protein